MLRLMGAFLVIVPLGVMGMAIGRNFGKRPDQIRQLQFGLQALETEIIYSATPLPQALNKVGSQLTGPVGNLFTGSGSQLLKGEGNTAGEIWTASLKDLKGYLMLDETDLLIMEQFGQGLGMSDRQDQLKRLKMARSHLEAREKEAEKERLNFQKVWQVLGWALGIVITLLFF